MWIGGAVLLVGANVWAWMMIDDWKGQVDHDRSEAAVLGGEIANARATEDNVVAALDRIRDQVSEADARIGEIESNLATVEARASEAKTIAAELDRCIDDRRRLIDAVWSWKPINGLVVNGEIITRCDAVSSRLDALFPDGNAQ